MQSTSLATLAIDRQLPSVRAIGTPKRARAEHSRRSQASAIAQPPPTAGPSTAAIVGRVTRSRRSNTASSRRSYATPSAPVLKSRNCAMSVPAANDSPEPRMIRTRRPGVPSTSSQASTSASYMSQVSALRA